MLVRWSIEVQRRLIMHPSIHEQMSKQRMEALQHEAAVAQRINHAKKDLDNKTGSNSLTQLLWYLLFGVRIPTPNQKQGEEYSIGGLQANLNAITRVVGCVALGFGLLIGGFLYSSFGLLPIVLLASIILVVVSIPILMRSVSVLSKHNQVPSHR
jgi:hypothetical protein